MSARGGDASSLLKARYGDLGPLFGGSTDAPESPERLVRTHDDQPSDQPSAAPPGNAIRGLTLWQPWASLWAAGIKLYETRAWQTDYRGLIAVHAGKRWDAELLELCRTDDMIRRAIGQLVVRDQEGANSRKVDEEIERWLRDPPRGGYVGLVHLTDIVPIEEILARRPGAVQLALGDARRSHALRALRSLRLVQGLPDRARGRALKPYEMRRPRRRLWSGLTADEAKELLTAKYGADRLEWLLGQLERGRQVEVHGERDSRGEHPAFIRRSRR